MEKYIIDLVRRAAELQEQQTVFLNKISVSYTHLTLPTICSV